MVFSGDETAGVGIDDATPVSADYKEGNNAFTGRILKVVVEVQPMTTGEASREKKARNESNARRALSN
jgi:hypothetical protein